MKHALIVFFVTLFCTSSYSQKVHFTDSGNVWKVLQPVYDAPNPWILNYYSLSFIRDSTSDSIDYKEFTFGLVREDTLNKKVYLLSTLGEVLLMDYNLRVGDTFTSAYHKFPVISMDSTIINAVWHKVWHLKPELSGFYGSTDITVIEGIGCIQHPTYLLQSFSGCVECAQPVMYCFKNYGISPALSPAVRFLNNTTSCSYYPTLSEDKLSLSVNELKVCPNPVTDKIILQFPTEGQHTVTITNVMGQVTIKELYNLPTVEVDVSNLPNGVYFIKINDYAVKRLMKL